MVDQLFLEVNLDGLLILILAVMFGPSLLLTIVGFVLRADNRRKAAKWFFIIAVVYLIISLGVCGALMIS